VNELVLSRLGDVGFGGDRGAAVGALRESQNEIRPRLRVQTRRNRMLESSAVD
jgi:hypothetical protein